MGLIMKNILISTLLGSALSVALTSLGFSAEPRVKPETLVTGQNLEFAIIDASKDERFKGFRLDGPISGCKITILVPSGPDMLMMDWSIAEIEKRQKPCLRDSKHVLRSAACNCIPRKRALCIVKTMIVREVLRRKSSSTSSATHSVRDGPKTVMESSS